MRVLFLDTAITFGGGQESLVALLEGLTERGIETHTLAPARGGLLLCLEERGLPHGAWPVASRARKRSGFGAGELVDLVRGAAFLARRLREARAHVVHANGERAALVCALLPKRLRPFTLFHDRTLEERRGMVRWIGGRSDAVVAVSSAVAAKHSGGGAPILRTIPDGIDLARFSPLPARREPGPMVFAFVGRMSSEKGPDLFVEAARLLLRRNREAVFLLCGEPPVAGRSAADDRVLSLMTEEGPSGRIRHVGFQQDMALFLEKVDVVVVPSRREGLGIAAVEALARGKPVIARRVGGLPEVVSHGEVGLLVDGDDPSDLADAMESLLTDRVLFERMSAAAPAKASSFSRDEMVRSIEQIYRQARNSSL